MRTDRLLAETIYLLEHGRTSAREMAARFEVSPRTVLRDMDSLCMAGVPVISFEGIGGGFELEESYRLDHKTANQEDVSLILTALQALSTAIEDQKLLSAIDKFHSLKAMDSELHVDLSALNEDARIQGHLRALRKAIKNKHAVHMQYTSTAGRSAEHTVEPISLHYQWYSWYLHAYSRVKNAVLTYKLVRMDWVKETDEPCLPHPDAAPPCDDRPEITLRVRCRESARVPLIEYLHAIPDRQTDDGDWLLTVSVPSDERFWRGALLSLGDQVEILSPPEIICEFRRYAQEVLSLYEGKP